VTIPALISVEMVEPRAVIRKYLDAQHIVNELLVSS
jgi:hypothetical protein